MDFYYNIQVSQLATEITGLTISTI